MTAKGVGSLTSGCPVCSGPSRACVSLTFTRTSRPLQTGLETVALTKIHGSLIMFAKSTRRDRNPPAEVEYTEPLLGSTDDLPNNRTIFSVDEDDDDDDVEGTALNTSKSDHSVHFREEVQVIGQPLRSTLASREAGVYVSHSPCSCARALSLF